MPSSADRHEDVLMIRVLALYHNGWVPSLGISGINTEASYPDRKLTMALPSLLGFASMLLLLLPAVSATAFTTTISANERLCFYADVDKPKEKIGFYFAVQAGGSFDINYEVTNPAGKARAGVRAYTTSLSLSPANVTGVTSPSS